MSHELQRVPFHSTSIIVTPAQMVALRPACEAIGLDFDGQRRRLERQPWATVVMTTTVASDGKTRDMLMLDRRTFTMWLATVETSRLKSEAAKAMLATFQREAADALDRYFHEGGAINPRATEHQMNAVIFQARAQMELAQASKGLVHPDHLEAKARIILARGMFEVPEIDPARRPLYCHDFLREKNIGQRAKRIAGTFGKAVKKRYIEVTGRAPMKYDLTLGNGQVRQVNGYIEADRWLLDEVWTAHFETQGVLA